MQEPYPEPMVADDAQYYQLASHQEQEPQIGQQQAVKPETPTLPNIAMEQQQPTQDQQHAPHPHELEGLQSLPEQQAPQEQQQPPQEAQISPQQQIQEQQDQTQQSRPAADAVDELQLAAQLTQNLAPMMVPVRMDGVPSEPQDQQALPQQDSDVSNNTETNLQEQLEASLQHHDREMQNHAAELQTPQEHHQHHHLQNHELQAHGLSNMLSPTTRPPQHHYAQAQGAPAPPPPPPPPPHAQIHPHLQSHLPPEHHHHLGPGAGAPGYSMGPDGTGPPARKRTKVSRACDECRRKKIKCDAQCETSDEPCSNCRRSNVQCLFSRVPQKRGPSKGYVLRIGARAVCQMQADRLSAGTSRSSLIGLTASRGSSTVHGWKPSIP